MPISSLAFRGTGFTSPKLGTVDRLEDHLFVVNTAGVIERVLSPNEADFEVLVERHRTAHTYHELSPTQYLLPGFIDLHIHAPQWPQRGTALDLPLNEWLNTYTFPLEARYKDMEFARRVYDHLVTSLLRCGTTTGLFFATVDYEPSLLLAELCADHGMRGLVGKVVMDDPNENPDFYRDPNTATALSETERFINAVREIGANVKQGVYPVVTPRFIPSCTDEALRGLGELASHYDTHIQSHCSEGDWEHGFVLERFGKHDAFALNDFGLLKDKSVMAHCNFLSEEDAELFRATGTAIAHCPLSNAYFADAVIPLRRWAANGLEIGLGTDISAGFSASIYGNLRQAIVSSRMLEDGVDTALPPDRRGVPDSRLTLDEAFYFATTGGAMALGLPIGQLVEGCAWDVQVVDTAQPDARLPIFDSDEPLEIIFQKVLYLATHENIREVWVQGRQVVGR